MWSDRSVHDSRAAPSSRVLESAMLPRCGRLMLFALPLVIFSFGCGKGTGIPATTSPGKAKLKRNVELAQATDEKMASTVETVGYLDAEGQSDIAAGVPGVVEEAYFREGDWVI